MVNIAAVLCSNGIAVALLLILFFNVYKIASHGLIDDKIFRVMILTNIGQCILETATLYIDGMAFPGCREMSILLNALLFAGNIVFSFMWVLYADFKLFSDVERLKKKYQLILVPGLIVLFGIFINLFVPVYFSVSSGNIYHRTALFFIPYVVTYFYLVYGVVLIYKYRNKVKKYLFLPAVIFMVPIFLGSLIQLFCYGISLVWVGVSVALTSMYINVQNTASYVDPLSGLFTRRYMNQYLQSKIDRHDPQKLLVGVMIDIDRFKSINDTYGHLAGDDAISSIGNIIHSSVLPGDLAVRFAGDEFIIITIVERKEEIIDLIERIKMNSMIFNTSGQKPYKINFSIGYSIYGAKDDSLDKLLRRMDDAMYQDKKSKDAREQ